MKFFKTQIDLRRKIIQLEETIKDWKKQSESYKNAFYHESKINRELNKELDFANNRIDAMQKNNRKMQEQFDFRLRQAFNPHVKWDE